MFVGQFLDYKFSSIDLSVYSFTDSALLNYCNFRINLHPLIHQFSTS